MNKIARFIIRRWKLFLLLFAILSIFAAYLINRKEVLYKAEARIVFVGKGGFSRPDVEAKKIKERDFLQKISGQIPRLDLPALEDNLSLEFRKENILLLSFISADPLLARDAVNAASGLFLKERDDIVKDLKKKREAKLRGLSDEAEELRYNLNLSKNGLRDLKQKNNELDNRRIDLQRRLADLELQKGELLKLFTQMHPEVIAVSERIDSVRSQLGRLPDNLPLYNRLAAEAEEKALAFSLKQKECDELADSFKKTGEDWRAELIESAPLPFKPIGRQKDWYYRWGFLAVFSASFLCSLIVEAADRRIYTREEAQQHLKLPVIAEINRIIIPGKKKIKDLELGEKAVFDYRSSPQLLRRYEQLYTFLKLDIFKGDIDSKVILITSAEPQTGKTFTACNLALAAAKNGERVLLVDANFRHPSVDRFFGFEKEAKGLSDILKGSLTHNEAVKNLTDLLLTGSLKLNEEELKGFDNLKILLSGSSVESPLELLEAKELSDLFKRLYQSHGILIIDSSSLRGYADTFNLLASVDAILLVARKGKSSYPLLKDVISQVKKVNGPLTGLVFSHV